MSLININLKMGKVISISSGPLSFKINVLMLTALRKDNLKSQYIFEG